MKLSFRTIFGPDSWVPALVALFAVILLLNYYFPMMTDEAYYMTWARRSTWPEWGFFDHPPFVSWQGFLARFWPQILAARLGVIAASLVTFFVNIRIAKLLFNNPRHAFCAAVLASSTTGAIANTFLFTPDSGLIMWWSIALHEAIVATKVTPRRWLTTGLATGFGFLSKYTMALMGLVFLYGLWRDKRRPLLSPWPYYGAAVMLLTIAPHLAWNAEHDWITFRFQFGHGMSIRQDLTIGSTLPKAFAGGKNAPTLKLYEDLQGKMSGVAGFEETKPKPRPQVSKLERAWQYSGDYLGGLAGLWGLYSLWWLYRVAVRKFAVPAATSSRAVGPHATNEWNFIHAAFWMPVVLFGLLSPFTKIEANWPAMHMVAGALLLVRFFNPSPQIIRKITFAHVAIAVVLVILATHASQLPNARNNRLVVETAGYDQLTSFVRGIISDQKLAVDSYQLKSAFAIRAPEITTVQWPGITRPSEYTRGSLDDQQAAEQFLHSEQFSLLSFEDIPLELPNYTPIKLQGIRSCPDGSIASYSSDHPVLPCEKGLRDWWITTYHRTETSFSSLTPKESIK